MLVYDDVASAKLRGTKENIPTITDGAYADNEVIFKVASGTAPTLTKTSKILDNGEGGMKVYDTTTSTYVNVGMNVKNGDTETVVIPLPDTDTEADADDESDT